MPPPVAQRLLRSVSALFVVAALFHFGSAISPPLEDTAGPFRHAVFVAINLVSAACLWLRPRWFDYAFLLLLAQQLASHGGDAWRLWVDRGQVDFASVGVVVVMPVTAWALWTSRR